MPTSDDYLRLAKEAADKEIGLGPIREGSPADPPAIHDRQQLSVSEAEYLRFELSMSKRRAEAVEARLASFCTQLEREISIGISATDVWKHSDNTERWIRASDLRALLDTLKD